MKPATPLLTHNAAKSSISREQRCQRFHPTTKTGPQWCHRFQPRNALHQIGKQCTRQHTIAETSPLPRNFARNSIGKSTNKVLKRCNSNDLNSMFERVVGELRAKLGAVSAAMCAGAGHEACGVKARPGRASRRRAEPHISDQAPLVWRAPEGPEGTGGLRDRPLRAAGSRVAISRAAGPDGARNTRGATSNTSRKAAAHGHTKQPGPTTHHAAPGTPAAPRATQHRGAGPQARAPGATTQTRMLRSTDVPSRSARAARRWRRSSRSPRLRRRAGPRR